MSSAATPVWLAVLTAIPNFCFSCGAPLDVSKHPPCGHPQDDVHWTPDQIGSVIELKGLIKTQAVLVAVGRKPTVVVPSGKEDSISQKRLEEARVILDMSSVPSPLFRLETIAARSERWAKGVRKWLRESGRVDRLLASPSDRRLYARSAIAGGDVGAAAKAGLSPAEFSWLRMNARAAAGDHSDAASIALELPVGGYPDKVNVLLAALAHSEWEPSVEDRSTISQFPNTLPAAVVIKAAAGAQILPNSWGEVRAALELESEASNSQWLKRLLGEVYAGDDQKAPLRSLATGRSSSSPDLDYENRTLPERVVSASFGIPLVASPTEIEELAKDIPSVLDDLVDSGKVSVSGDLSLLPVELRTRVVPESLTDEELVEWGNEWERSRRSYEAGNAPDSPQHTAAGRHYRALAALRDGDTSQAEALSDPDGILAAVVNTFASGVLDDRAISDPTVWPVLDRFINESHLDRNPGAAGRWNLRRSLANAFAWDWEESLRAGKESLRLSQDEAARDEALNLIAFALYQLGRDEEAVTALERALEGEYTPNLQANAGVVAERMAPDRAAFHLGRLAAEAPSNELRLAAVRRAFQVWSQSRPVWDDDEDEDVRIPGELLNAMRSLAVLDTPPEDHREIMRLLAHFDAEWVADASNMETSCHRDTWGHRLYVARANHDPNEYIEVLAAALKAEPDEDWLIEERDGFITSMRSLIFENIENIGPAAYAYAAIDAGLPMEPFDRVTLTCGAIISICSSLAANKNEPSYEVYDHFLKATKTVEELDPGQREMVDDLVGFAGDSYARTVAIFRHEMLQQGFSALESIGRQLYGIPRYRVKWSVVTESLRPLREMVDDSVRTLKTAKQHARDQEIQEGIDALIGEFTRLRGFAAKPRSAF